MNKKKSPQPPESGALTLALEALAEKNRTLKQENEILQNFITDMGLALPVLPQSANVNKEKRTRRRSVADVAAPPEPGTPKGSRRGCTCKGNCSTRNCGCVKKNVACSEFCRCGDDLCENVEEDKENAGDPNAEPPNARETRDKEPKDKESNAREPKSKEAKVREPKTGEQNVRELRDKESDAREPKAREPKAREPKAKEPNAREPKAKEPKGEEPQAEEPKAGGPKARATRAREPKPEEQPEEPRARATKAREPKPEEQPEEPKARATKARAAQPEEQPEEPKARATKAREPKAREPNAGKSNTREPMEQPQSSAGPTDSPMKLPKRAPKETKKTNAAPALVDQVRLRGHLFSPIVVKDELSVSEEQNEHPEISEDSSDEDHGQSEASNESPMYFGKPKNLTRALNYTTSPDTDPEFNPMKPKRQLSRSPVASRGEPSNQRVVERSEIPLPAPLLEESDESAEEPEELKQAVIENWDEHKAKLVKCMKCGRKLYAHRIKKHEQSCQNI